MFNLFKKKDKPKVDAAEIERREREEVKKQRAEALKQTVDAEKTPQKS